MRVVYPTSHMGTIPFSFIVQTFVSSVVGRHYLSLDFTYHYSNFLRQRDRNRYILLLGMERCLFAHCPK